MWKRIKFLAITVAAVLVQSVAWAEATEGAAAMAGSDSLKSVLALTAGFGLSLAVIGGAISQSRAATKALEGIARNPEAAGKIQTPMIIALALIESLVIYALVIAFMLQGKI